MVADSSFTIPSPRVCPNFGSSAARGNQAGPLDRRRIMSRWRLEATDMKRKPHYRASGKKARTVLRLPDLEHAKTAVLNSLTNFDSQRGSSTPWTSSLIGTAQSRAWRLTVPW